MPKLNRRNFLQIVTAASVAPALPALPARAAVASQGAVHSKMLWASLSARAGSAAKFAGVARSMGLSTQTAQGVYANVARSQIVAAHRVSRLGRTPLSVRTNAPRVARRPERPSLEIDKLVSDRKDDARAEAPRETDIERNPPTPPKPVIEP
jgi:hypothetical protein